MSGFANRSTNRPANCRSARSASPTFACALDVETTLAGGRANGLDAAQTVGPRTGVSDFGGLARMPTSARPRRCWKGRAARESSVGLSYGTREPSSLRSSEDAALAIHEHYEPVAARCGRGFRPAARRESVALSRIPQSAEARSSATAPARRLVRDPRALGPAAVAENRTYRAGRSGGCRGHFGRFQPQYGTLRGRALAGQGNTTARIFCRDSMRTVAMPANKSAGRRTQELRGKPAGRLEQA